MNGVIEVPSALQGHQQAVRPSQARQIQPRPVPVALQPANSRWALYRHRWNSRRVLLTLTEDELRDIGLDLAQARQEAAKPFWRE